jgi:alkaline phosphatase D
MQFIDDHAILSKKIESLELELSTIKANDAASLSWHYVNIVFSDGSRLYEPENLPLYRVGPEIEGTLPGPGQKKRYKLSFKDNFPNDRPLDRTLGEIAEVFIRKAGDDAWFVGSVLLFANTDDPDMPDMPLLGNSKANQFLDNNDHVLQLRDWSTSSFCVAQSTYAKHPLARSGYRILGPVIGLVSDTSAVVLYRVDREGNYRFRAIDTVTHTLVYDETRPLDPTGRFELNSLRPNRLYDFNLSFVRGGDEFPVPDAAGSLRTFPPEGSLGRFTFAFGSCVNPGFQLAQGSWTGIRMLAETPPTGIDPVRLFIHLGDSFYFYDTMTDEIPPLNVESMHAAHVSMRRHIEFLDVAKVVPSYGIWDDHDFAGDDLDSTSMSNELR